MMNDFRNRPKDNYIYEANWQKLYMLTEHWKSDLSFYRDDLSFLHHLIDAYFLWISKKENIDMLQKMEVNLLKIDKQCASLLERTNKHLHHLSELIEDPFKYDSHHFRAEHEVLEDKLTQFLKDFRQNRKEIFTIKEHIIDGEELVRHLNVVPK
tara:strand:- start:486 stop:947 length:462 start_codon:yes stop_codon:yes gene_type:complete